MPLKNWKEALDGIEYDSAAEERGGSRALAQASYRQVLDATRYELVEMAMELTMGAGYELGIADCRMENVLSQYVNAKFLNGALYDSPARADLEFVWNLLPQMEAKIKATPGLIESIAEYPDWPGPFLEPSRIDDGKFCPSIKPICIKFDLDSDDLEILRSVFTNEGEPLPSHFDPDESEPGPGYFASDSFEHPDPIEAPNFFLLCPASLFMY